MWGFSVEIVLKMTACRGNPEWLPILRAATQGRPYNSAFDSGWAGLGFG